MNAVEYLIKQHRQIEEGLGAVADASGAERRTHFAKAADLLMSHVLVEEERFYPAIKARRTEDILLESLEEHLSLKRLVVDLLDMPTDDARFEAKLHVLKEQSEHHHKEEEEHLFPKVKKCFDDARLEELGRELEASQKQLLRDSPRERARGQTAAAAEV